MIKFPCEYGFSFFRLKIDPVKYRSYFHSTSIQSKPRLSNFLTKNNISRSNSIHRNYCELPNKEQLPRQRTLPRLTAFPDIIWPSAVKSIKNWAMVNFIIRPYFDRDFYMEDFIFGAKRALQVVSSRLANGDIHSVENLIAKDTAEKLKPIINNLSLSQRKQLEIKQEDIYLSFPYQIGIMFDESNNNMQKRWVEITMVFHILRGLAEMRHHDVNIPWNMGSLPEYQDKVFVCNYRFIKEFTQGHESDWTVNIINHFKPIDLINEES